MIPLLKNIGNQLLGNQHPFILTLLPSQQINPPAAHYNCNELQKPQSQAHKLPMYTTLMVQWIETFQPQLQQYTHQPLKDAGEFQMEPPRCKLNCLQLQKPWRTLKVNKVIQQSTRTPKEQSLPYKPINQRRTLN